MNNSWNSSTQSSPGFVYFANNATTPQKPAETSEFMGFIDTEPSPKKFSPRNYSSPQQQWGSPRNYNGYRGRNKTNRYAGHNLSFSPNNSHNMSYNRNNNHSYNKFNQNKMEKSLNKNKFLHPSFMEDPWAILEAKLKAKTNSQMDGIICSNTNVQDSQADNS